MTNKEKKNLLVFIDTRDSEGHEMDFRLSLKKALGIYPYWIFEDFSKKPESIFSATVGGILISQAVVLDGAPQTKDVSPDSLIRYGICRALNKQCVFVGIKSNIIKGKGEINETIVEHYIEFNHYLHFATQFRDVFLEQLKSPANILKVKPNKLPVHSFIVFGFDRWKKNDLYESITNFSNGTGWSLRIVSDIGSFSKLESLANAVSQRSFCIFCLDDIRDEKVFIGIGLAIGMGRPFLIIKHKLVPLPNSLLGYHGVIEYESYSQLKTQLVKYTSEFLSEEVFYWEGATYNDLLFKLEKQIGGMSPRALDEVEGALQTVISVLGDSVAKPYALIGEIYREKHYRVSPDNTDYLKKAKEYYEQAAKIQGGYKLYQNASDAIDRHIQLMELIKEKRYRSIPGLINLIGGDVNSVYYLQVREYLLTVVKKLVEENEFVYAISLLVAMQTHDKSEQIKKLVQEVLNLAPYEIIKALQNTQSDVINLESEKAKIVVQLKEKEAQLDKMSEELEVFRIQIDSNEDELLTLKDNLERIQSERDNLEARLKDISVQLDADHRTVNEFETKIESAKNIDKQVIVNFGDPYGWAIYRAVDSEPYVVRAGERLSAKKGLVLDWGDIIYDEEGSQILELLPRNAIVVRPDNDYYADVSRIVEDND